MKHAGLRERERRNCVRPVQELSVMHDARDNDGELFAVVVGRTSHAVISKKLWFVSFSYVMQALTVRSGKRVQQRRKILGIAAGKI